MVALILWPKMMLKVYQSMPKLVTCDVGGHGSLTGAWSTQLSVPLSLMFLLESTVTTMAGRSRDGDRTLLEEEGTHDHTVVVLAAEVEQEANAGRFTDSLWGTDEAGDKFTIAVWQWGMRYWVAPLAFVSCLMVYIVANWQALNAISEDGVGIAVGTMGFFALYPVVFLLLPLVGRSCGRACTCARMKRHRFGHYLKRGHQGGGCALYVNTFAVLVAQVRGKGAHT